MYIQSVANALFCLSPNATVLNFGPVIDESDGSFAAPNCPTEIFIPQLRYVPGASFPDIAFRSLLSCSNDLLFLSVFPY